MPIAPIALANTQYHQYAKTCAKIFDNLKTIFAIFETDKVFNSVWTSNTAKELNNVEQEFEFHKKNVPELQHLWHLIFNYNSVVCRWFNHLL